jgi:ABC-type transport system involved in multi-copper enzyme maturation permease subunit
MPLLAVPLSRGQYLMGRYLGAALVQTAALVTWCASLAGILAANGYFVPGALLPATLLLVAEGWFLLAVVFFFSFWTSPPLNAPLTLLLFILCQMSASQFAGLVPWAQGAMGILRLLLPHMDVFHIKDPVAHRIPVPTGYFLLASLYGFSYTAFMLSLALAVFRRRDPISMPNRPMSTMKRPSPVTSNDGMDPIPARAISVTSPMPQTVLLLKRLWRVMRAKLHTAVTPCLLRRLR